MENNDEIEHLQLFLLFLSLDMYCKKILLYLKWVRMHVLLQVTFVPLTLQPMRWLLSYLLMTSCLGIITYPSCLHLASKWVSIVLPNDFHLKPQSMDLLSYLYIAFDVQPLVILMVRSAWCPYLPPSNDMYNPQPQQRLLWSKLRIKHTGSNAFQYPMTRNETNLQKMICGENNLEGDINLKITQSKENQLLAVWNLVKLKIINILHEPSLLQEALTELIVICETYCQDLCLECRLLFGFTDLDLCL